MVFKRVFMPVFFVGMILILGSAAYAQTVDCQLTVPSPTDPTVANATGRGTSTGLSEPVAAGSDGTNGQSLGPVVVPAPQGNGTLRVTCTNNTAATINTSVAVLTLSFGATITNGTAHPAAAPIKLVVPTAASVPPYAGANIFAPAPVPVNVGQPVPSNSSGQLSMVFSTTGTTAGAGIAWAAGNIGVFDVKGVLVSLSGLASTQLQANLSLTTPGTGYSVSANTKTVISNIMAGLAAEKVTIPTAVPTAVADLLYPGTSTGALGTSGGSANFNLAGVGLKPNFALRIEENYQDLFKSGAQFNGGGTFPSPGTSSTQVEVRFTGVPQGLTIGGCGAALTDLNGNISPGGAAASSPTITQGSFTLTVGFGAPVNQGQIDVLWVVCTTVTATAGTVLPSAAVSAQVTMSPTGTALSATNGVQNGVTNGQIPRYAAAYLPATGLNVVNFPAASVALLIPFATVVGGYNTGIAISNTTTDPLGSPSLASAQNGTLTFTFFDNSGAVKSYTTAASSPGQGLAGGVLNSGKTYVVNLSELLAAATMPSTFTGYIFIQTNFTNAHGAAYVYNGAGFTSAAPVLVVGFARTTPETLGQ